MSDPTDCPVLRVAGAVGPRPHMWMVLEISPWNALTKRKTIAFFCQWCLATMTRHWEELEILQPVRATASSIRQFWEY